MKCYYTLRYLVVAAAAVGWDTLCDKHLIIGVFKHGYGRLDLIKDDPSLVFESKVKQALSETDGLEDDGSKRPKKSGAEIQQSNIIKPPPILYWQRYLY